MRRERIAELATRDRRILVATDRLSEGINLKDHFDAVLHHHLPWNPNRIEQREGRVDRFGQPRETVRTLLLYGTNNDVDQVVFDVLLRKARTIRTASAFRCRCRPVPRRSCSTSPPFMALT